MPQLTIDQRTVSVPPGATILDAAHLAGVIIPTLCHAPGLPHQTACLVCVVQVVGSPRLTPACGTPATEGMVVTSHSPAVQEARRTAMELLLGDHEGECLAPCENACAAGIAIPKLLRQVSSGDMGGAVATLKSRLALPALLTRLCGAACEKGCRRGVVARQQGATGKPLDHAVAIGAVEQAVLDHDRSAPWLPTPLPASGKHIAVVGSGPAGLAAAWVLIQAGHACTVLEKDSVIGGGLRHAAALASFSPELLHAELNELVRLGVIFCPNVNLATAADLDRLARNHDAVILALGESLDVLASNLGLTPPDAIGHNHRSGWSQVFIARSNANRQAVRSAVEGRSVATTVSRYVLNGGAAVFAEKNWSMRNLPKRPWNLDIQALRSTQALAQDLGGELAAQEAERCLQCGCAKAEGCRLRSVAATLGAESKRYSGTAMAGEPDRSHRLIDLDPAKCIACGLCVAWCELHRPPVGLGFTGRGPRLGLGLPLGHRLAELSDEAAKSCAALCPSGALAVK